MKATKIKMKSGCGKSDNLLEIDSVYIADIAGGENPGYLKKETLYDYLKENPKTIQVDIWPYPNLVPAMSAKNEKYVKSSPNSSNKDNLLCLPRE
jgi:hypothetical protein